jgi:hypothetical protein
VTPKWRVDRDGVIAHFLPRDYSVRMNDPLHDKSRLAYTLDETAAMFGKHRSWAYRQVRTKQLKVITGYGAMLVPRSEIERILNSACELK